MGWYMVKWGAGVHQWQVTLGQLFNQLFVSVYEPVEDISDFIISGQIRPRSSIALSVS